MTVCKGVDVPKRMEHLETDHRGYPIPFIVGRDNNGKPMFTVNDERKTKACIADSLCGICGGELTYGDLWWIGGPMSAFHPHGAYIDGPMHRECSTFALIVCPHLALRNYSRRVDDRGYDLKGSEFSVAIDQTMIPERPDIFIQSQSISYDVSWPLSPNRYLHPRSGFFERDGKHVEKRWLDYEVWRHGEVLEESVGIQLIRDAMEKAKNAERAKPKIIRPPALEV